MKLLSAILIFASLTASAQYAGFRARLDKASILIGEQAILTLSIETQSADTLILPDFNDTLIEHIEILEISKRDTAYTGANLTERTIEWQLTLTSFDSGYYAVAPLLATVNGKPLQSNPFLLSVQPVPIDTAKGIYDIRGVAQTPFSLKEWLQENWIWLTSGILIILLITAFIIWYYNRPKPEPKEVVIPTTPPFEIAMERLDALEKQKLWQAGKVKAFYSELTELLREYIELQYRIPALEQTTDEIIQAMRRKPNFTVDQISETKQVLFLADLVKFAKENPVGSENDQNLERIKEFILRTKNENQSDSNG